MLLVNPLEGTTSAEAKTAQHENERRGRNHASRAAHLPTQAKAESEATPMQAVGVHAGGWPVRRPPPKRGSPNGPKPPPPSSQPLGQHGRARTSPASAGGRCSHSFSPLAFFSRTSFFFFSPLPFFSALAFSSLPFLSPFFSHCFFSHSLFSRASFFSHSPFFSRCFFPHSLFSRRSFLGHSTN